MKRKRSEEKVAREMEKGEAKKEGDGSLIEIEGKKTKK